MSILYFLVAKIDVIFLTYTHPDLRIWARCLCKVRQCFVYALCPDTSVLHKTAIEANKVESLHDSHLTPESPLSHRSRRLNRRSSDR